MAKRGYFLRVDNDKMIYELVGDFAKLFFCNVQDFWSKKVFELNDSNKEIRNNVSLTFKGKSEVKLWIDRDDFFKAELKDKRKGNVRPNNLEFKKLFSFLSNEADRISILSDDDYKLTSDNSFLLRYNKKEFFILKEGREIVVVNKKFRNKYHYSFIDLPISLQYNDYFL